MVQYNKITENHFGEMDFDLHAISGGGFVDRKEIVQEIVAAYDKPGPRLGFALYGLRRVGKTSILQESMSKLRTSNHSVVVYLSVFELLDQTLEEFSRELTNRVIDAYGPKIGLKHKAQDIARQFSVLAKEALKSIRLSLAATEEIELALYWKPTDKTSNLELVERPFTLAQRLSEETKVSCVFIIDEFPEIMKLRNGRQVGDKIFGVLRTLFEKNKGIVLTIAGSSCSLMESITLHKSSPFYRQFKVIKVPPMEDKHIRRIITTHMPGTSEKTLDEVARFCNGIPYYANVIGLELKKRSKKDVETVKQIAEEYLTQYGDIIFTQEFQQLTPYEKQILIAITRDNHTPARISKATGQPSNNVSKYLNILDQKALVVKTGKGIYDLTDQVYKRWIMEKQIKD